MTIPRRLHWVWAGDDPMPAEFADNIEGWHYHHPHWQHTVWTPETLRGWMQHEALYDEAATHCPGDEARFRADIARLEILHRYGGVYLDTDITCIRPIDPLIDTHGVTALVGRSPNARGFALTNAVMASTPGHHWLGQCLEMLPESVERYRGQRLAVMVGPYHITRAYQAIAGVGVTLMPERFFFPQSVAQRDAGETPDVSESYGLHKWNNSLRRQGKGVPATRRPG